MAQEEKILVLDRGSLEFIYPGDWSVHPEPTGCLTLCNPTQDCRLDVLFGRLSRAQSGEPSLVPVDEVLRHFLEEVPETKQEMVLNTEVENNCSLAHAHYTYGSRDTEGRQKQPSHARWLVARNHLFQTVLSFRHRSEDTPAAVPVWQRITETLHLGDGIPLSSPEDHWSLRKPN